VMGSPATLTWSAPTVGIVIDLGAQCSSSGGAATSITWCTTGSSQRYALRRITGAQSVCSGGVVKADRLTRNDVFLAATANGGGVRAKLSVDLPVDAKPGTGGGAYELKDDIVLRNTSR
jgi:hypothetical protein